VSRKGFTLIELLVVISIVALLSSIVLSALNAARGKAADSTVKASLRQIAAQTELYLSQNPDLGISAQLCTTAGSVFMDPKIVEIRADILTKARTLATMSCATDDTGSKFAVGISALKGAGTTWCIDNNAFFGVGTVNTATGECN
jgi:prepilin-type N-terminal cleavage/methylation domain-containing protein